jgi:hypothetical protein
MEQYKIPLYQKSSLKWYLNVLLIFCTLFMAAGSVLFFVVIMKDDFILGLLFGIFAFLLSLWFAYISIWGGALKKFYIEMTSEYIKVSLPFKTKVAYWREIYEAQTYEYNNNTMISILLEKDRNKKRRRTVSNSFNSMYGIPPYSFQISFMFFKDIDAQRLLFTIGEQINKVNKQDYIETESLNEDYEEYQDSIAKAIVSSILSYLFISAIYGISIYKLEKNYIVIPIFGAFLIISVFNKFYLEKSFSLSIRILLGVMCLIQVPTALITAIILSEEISISLTNILNITNEYFKYLAHNPLKQIIVIIVAIICFAIGSFKGRINKEKIKLDVYK